MGEYLMLKVPEAEATALWLQDHTAIERGEQIEATFDFKAVSFVGLSAVPKIGSKSATYGLHFAYANLEQALAEFLVVGSKLQFPPGTRLIHGGSGWETAFAAIRTAATW